MTLLKDMLVLVLVFGLSLYFPQKGEDEYDDEDEHATLSSVAPLHFHP